MLEHPIVSPARPVDQSITAGNTSADVDILIAMAFGEAPAADADAAAAAIADESLLVAIAVGEAGAQRSLRSTGAAADASGLSRAMAYGATAADPDPESRWRRTRGCGALRGRALP